MQSTLLLLFLGIEEKHLCQNNGCCHDTVNSHYCVCSSVYDGSYCERQVNECASAPCSNGATCVDLVGKFRCECAPGFQGLYCEFDIDECAYYDQPCRNGATCHDLVDSFACSCPPGTHGTLCAENDDDCVTGDDQCFNGGKSVDMVGGYECLCRPGFVGQHCEGDVNECLDNPCSSAGTQACIQLVDDFRCDCKAGWSGNNFGHPDGRVNCLSICFYCVLREACFVARQLSPVFRTRHSTFHRISVYRNTLNVSAFRPVTFVSCRTVCSFLMSDHCAYDVFPFLGNGCICCFA